ncbi:MAG: M3 family metallopeptidase [Gammaproteobacteria bacterium]
MRNPLLEKHRLPEFSLIQPDYVEPAIEQLLKDNLEGLEALLARKPKTWETLMAPLSALNDRLQQAWSPVSHLNAVMNSEALRKAYNACIPKLTDYHTFLGQHQTLYQAIQYLKESPEYIKLNKAQQKAIEHALRDFKLSGVSLDEEKRKQFAEIEQKLSQLQNKFSENILDATDRFFMDIDSKADLAGLTEDALQLAHEKAKAVGKTGFRFGLDYPSFHAIMTYCDNRALRSKMYEAYVTRASDQGPLANQFDNTQIMEDIIALRHQEANLLGYASYAALSLERKMAKNPKEVIAFLEDLVQKAKPYAEKEIQELQRFAAEDCGQTVLEPWDIAYFSERLKRKLYDISQEELKSYFSLEKVLDGMFAIVKQLYGIHFERVHHFSTWHPDVRLYEAFDESNTLRGEFYIDLFARAQKRSGAWMDECRIRFRRDEGLQTPVAYLTCNFTPPTEDKPALLTHEEVETLFHEFGHTLHHILTLVDYAEVSGINGVPWDAVELPSQFFENWCWQEEALELISSHIDTGRPIEKALLVKLNRAKNFQAGMMLIRQLEFALFDFKLHDDYQPHQGPQVAACLKSVRDRVSVIKTPAFNRFQHSFSHIFSGGYAAGYYSYLWAEVLASDAFSRFEEEGVMNQVTGRSFLHHILEQGGSEEPAELFKAFRGRKPSIEPLLRHRGLQV